MLKSYKYRLYPNKEQEAFLAVAFGNCRFVYNELLSQNMRRYNEYREEGSVDKPKLGRNHLVKQIPILKANNPWLHNTPAVMLQQSAIDLSRAYTRFFNKKSKHPVFKTKRGKQSVRLVGTAFGIRDRKLFICKCPTTIKIKWSRELPSSPSSAVVTKDANGHYHVSFVCEYTPLVTNGDGKVGIDLGIKDLFTLSNGVKEENPKYLKRRLKRLKRLNRRHAKKNKGSSNSNKSRIKLAVLHSRIANSRRDRYHKLTRALVNENQLIAIESLNIMNMVKNRRLSASISDVSWGSFIRFLKEKAEESSRCRVIHVHPFFPSTHLCSVCNNRHPDKLSLSVRSWTCSFCSAVHDRDINAAKNILKVVTNMGHSLPNGSMVTFSWKDLVTVL